MTKTILTIFASALLAGSMLEAATAAEHHHIRKHYRAAPVVGPSFRSYSNPYDAYGWSYPDYSSYWGSRLEGGVISPPAGPGL